MNMTFQGSPRPVPIILPETPFSQRKRTPFRAQQLPMSPAKSCPPVSRVFTTPREHRGPQLVSFKSERKPTGVFVDLVFKAHCQALSLCYSNIASMCTTMLLHVQSVIRSPRTLFPT